MRALATALLLASCTGKQVEDCPADQVRYDDADGDGFGDPDTARIGCATDGVEAGGDCDDTNPDINPAAPERCNGGVDDDCDGLADGPGSADGVPLFTDADGDGFGDPGAPAEGCPGSAGLVQNDVDCDDGDASRHPGAVEVCNTLDDDCDGLVDQEDPDATAPTTQLAYPDADGDGFGAVGSSLVVGCGVTGSATADDCDDSDPLVHPGGREHLGDTRDSDCDGALDRAPFVFHSADLQAPRPPAVVQLDAGFAIASAADELDEGTPMDDVGLAFLVADDGTAGPIAVWQGDAAPVPLGARIDADGAGDTLWAAGTFANATDGQSYTTVRELTVQGTELVPDRFAFGGVPQLSEGIDVDVIAGDPTSPWAVACGPDYLHVLSGPTLPSPAASITTPTSPTMLTCFASSAPLLGTLEVAECRIPTGCLGHLFTAAAGTLLGSSTYLPDWYGVTGPTLFPRGDAHGSLHVVEDATGGAWIHTSTVSAQLFGALVVSSADAVERDGIVYAAAVGEAGAGPELYLAWGDPAAPLSVQELLVSDPTRPGLVPEGVAVAASDTTVAIAISGTSSAGGALGWVLLER